MNGWLSEPALMLITGMIAMGLTAPSLDDPRNTKRIVFTRLIFFLAFGLVVWSLMDWLKLQYFNWRR